MIERKREIRELRIRRGITRKHIKDNKRLQAASTAHRMLNADKCLKIAIPV